MLKESMGGESLDSSELMGETALVRLHVVVRPKIGYQVQYDTAELEKGGAAIVRKCHDDVRDELVRTLGDHDGVVLANR
ncbi:NAD-glutamate dehydrogenase, partial [Salmonella enterica subsp. enterica serovar Oranienburg]